MVHVSAICPCSRACIAPMMLCRSCSHDSRFAVQSLHRLLLQPAAAPRSLGLVRGSLWLNPLPLGVKRPGVRRRRLRWGSPCTASLRWRGSPPTSIDSSRPRSSMGTLLTLSLESTGCVRMTLTSDAVTPCVAAWGATRRGKSPNITCIGRMCSGNERSPGSEK